jgi:transcriptional repressor NrdR
MRCPSCKADDTKVVDSRAADDGAAIRRRRSCPICSFRFTTYERTEEVPLVVVKRSGAKEPFDRSKVVAGVRAAAKGRPVSAEQIDALATEVEDVMRLAGPEVTATQVGLAVLDALRTVDEVTYVRFASVYKGFDGGLRARAHPAGQGHRPQAAALTVTVGRRSFLHRRGRALWTTERANARCGWGLTERFPTVRCENAKSLPSVNPLPRWAVDVGGQRDVAHRPVHRNGRRIHRVVPLPPHRRGSLTSAPHRLRCGSWRMHGRTGGGLDPFCSVLGSDATPNLRSRTAATDGPVRNRSARAAICCSRTVDSCVTTVL